jgi:hypothetical protein
MQPFVVSLSLDGSTKRLVAVFDDGTRVRFGQPGATTYVDRATEQQKTAYLARHGSPLSRENWGPSGRQTAGYLSRWVLWGPTRDIAANVRRIGGTFE